jgi:hypothetical protein
MTEVPTMPPPARLRLNVISEVALMENGQARPIHILRTGTFTGQTGVAVTFEPEHIQSIVQNFQAGKRRKPPITERHDWGRAIGRMLDLWTDAAGENLYSLPKWTTSGRQLLSEEIYDGFSVELDADESGGYVLIGGSLTNYPAVDGLEPVTLSAPPIERVQDLHAGGAVLSADFNDPLVAPSAPSSPARPHTTTPSQETPIMAEPLDTTPDVVAPAPVALPPAPAIPLSSDPGMQARLDAYIAQINQRNEQITQQAFAQASAEFERKMRELEQRSQIEAFARQRTVTTADQPYAVPCTADELASLLTETPASVRGKWQALLSRITTSGLLSFDEIGSSGAAGEDADQWNTLVASYVAKGMSRVAAIQAAAKAQPSLYASQQYVKKGVR